tara:strand:+ start:25 stop:360 length:336 start_codon:yes stop_codon:yes gene_type:complete
MLLLISQIIIGTIWGLTSLLTASMFAAMFAPEKEQLLSRCFYMLLLLVPAAILIPLSFAACTLVVAAGFCVALTIVGPKGTAELIANGIPEIDEPDNLDPITKASAVERND